MTRRTEVVVTTYTTLNSTYEVDETNLRFRRLSGVNAPTPNVGNDGEWHDLHSVERFGPCLVFIFADGRHTITSAIVSEVSS